MASKVTEMRAKNSTKSEEDSNDAIEDICPAIFVLSSKKQPRGRTQPNGFQVTPEQNPESKVPLVCCHFAKFEGPAASKYSLSPTEGPHFAVVGSKTEKKEKEKKEDKFLRLGLYVNGDYWESPSFIPQELTADSAAVSRKNWEQSWELKERNQRKKCGKNCMRQSSEETKSPTAKRARTDSPVEEEFPKESSEQGVQINHDNQTNQSKSSSSNPSSPSHPSSSSEDEEEEEESSEMEEGEEMVVDEESRNLSHPSHHQEQEYSYPHHLHEHQQPHMYQYPPHPHHSVHYSPIPHPRGVPPPAPHHHSVPLPVMYMNGGAHSVQQHYHEGTRPKYFRFQCIRNDNGTTTVVSEQDFPMELIDSEDVRTVVPPSKKTKVHPEGGLYIRISSSDGPLPKSESERTELKVEKPREVSRLAPSNNVNNEEIYAALTEPELSAVARVLLPELNPNSIAMATSPFVKFCSNELLRLKAAVVDLRLRASIFTGVEMKEEIPTEKELQEKSMQYHQQQIALQQQQAMHMHQVNMQNRNMPPQGGYPHPIPPQVPMGVPMNTHTISINTAALNKSKQSPTPPVVKAPNSPPSSSGSAASREFVRISPPQIPTAANRQAPLPIIAIENVANEQILNRCLQSRWHEAKGKTKNSTPQIVIPQSIADQHLHKGSVRCYLVSSPFDQPENPNVPMNCEKVQYIIKNRCVTQMKSLAMNSRSMPLDGKFPARSDVPDIDIKNGYFAMLATLCEGDIVVAAGVSDPFRLNVKMKQFRDAAAAAERRRRHKKSNLTSKEEEDSSPPPPPMRTLADAMRPSPVHYPNSYEIHPYSVIPPKMLAPNSPQQTHHIMSIPTPPTSIPQGSNQNGGQVFVVSDNRM